MKIWIDALQFDNCGGWSEETQFTHEMGQGYLMAIGVPGIPVPPADTTFTAAQDGMYRFWVRCKNWLPSDSPGRFCLLVDGVRLPREMGLLPIEQWCWDTAGDLRLAAGQHKLQIEDTTGYFGRFAAVLVTDDMDFTPPQTIERIWAERARIIGEPTEIQDEGRWDVVVAGAGPAGIPAALAAARKGLQVILLHSRPGLGGNASDEGTVGFDGAYSHHPNMRETGIAEEIRRLHDANGWTWEAALTFLVRQEQNLEVRCNQFVFAAEVHDQAIRCVTTLDVRTTRRYCYHARFFIDCTGDGWLGYHAGASYRIGREAKWQYNEPLAPDTPDNLTMSGCIMGTCNGQQTLSYYAEDAGEPVAFSAPRWAVKLPDGDELHRFPNRLTTGEWWIENPTDIDDLWEQEKVRDELLRLSLGYFDWLKNSYAKRDLARNLRLVTFPRYNAKRETRRLIGDYVLTQNDCDQGRIFPDAVSYSGWPIDVHHPRGLFSGKEGPYCIGYPVPITTIPYRCLYSKNIVNLFMAGRCVSVSHIALGTVRVENTLATLGQAAGTAAAFCLQRGLTPRGLYEQAIGEFQQRLLRDDLFIPGIRNEDPLDLAQRANITATSSSRTERFHLRRGLPGQWHLLDIARAMAKANDPKPEFVAVEIRSEHEAEHELIVETIGLTQRNQFETAILLDRVTVPVAAGFSGWLNIPASVATDLPSIGIRLPAQPGFSWRSFDYTSFAQVRAWPINARHWSVDHSNAYCAEFNHYDDPVADCSPHQVVNGYGRPLDETRYAWVSDPAQSLPQTLDIHWDTRLTLRSVAVTFDTDLINPAYSYLRLPVVTRTVKDYQLIYYGEQGATVLADVKDNSLRYRRHVFEPIRTDHIQIKVTATHGDPSARIFEVRAYEERII